MALLFFGVFAPLGVVMRAFGYDPLRLKRDRSASSYWVRRSKPPSPMSTQS